MSKAADLHINLTPLRPQARLCRKKYLSIIPTRTKCLPTRVRQWEAVGCTSRRRHLITLNHTATARMPLGTPERNPSNIPILKPNSLRTTLAFMRIRPHQPPTTIHSCTTHATLFPRSMACNMPPGEHMQNLMLFGHYSTSTPPSWPLICTAAMTAYGCLHPLYPPTADHQPGVHFKRMVALMLACIHYLDL